MFAHFLRLRYISIIAVVSLFAGAVLRFLIGLARTVDSYLLLFSGISVQLSEHLTESSLTSVALIQAVD